ncbi:hypothetical protein EYF80_049072 [Liparis tanakae]|uniref:Uncharacterized protein n=1 Tax=Liparis tanakae TaxID=230148 RepID=A0A4Z2FHP7_9TELE|nr:hypothetical protein EYF80_049072 [Liparis tanakae]
MGELDRHDEKTFCSLKELKHHGGLQLNKKHHGNPPDIQPPLTSTQSDECKNEYRHQRKNQMPRLLLLSVCSL